MTRNAREAPGGVAVFDHGRPVVHGSGGHAVAGDTCPVSALHPEAIARVQLAQRPDEQYAELAETFRALGDASRARILHALLTEELCVCDLAALVGVSESAVSQHLRVLRGLRIVRHRKEGRVVYYSLEDACIRALLSVALTHLDDPNTTLAHGAPEHRPRRRPGHDAGPWHGRRSASAAEHRSRTDQ